MTEEAIFAEAVEKTAEERAGYLDEACRDNVELRGRVERLIHAFHESESFLESPAKGLGKTTDFTRDGTTADVIANRPVAEKVGAKIGPYKLLQQIGEGGMGTVFMAEQEKPVRRRVALKIIKPGMDTAQVVARFEAERQALAIMDHQNIARVLDAGATDTGRPFFVMELVKGVPITDYCDRNNLTPTDRLELFIPVCQAIQHAHQKGIIHRDIKPTNVLVTLYDGEPVPKVIDFGVAKAIEQKLTEKTMFTHFGAVIGTLEYMSPEQAEMDALDVDTRSDIYSLGVMLYELLTGSTPLERAKLRGAAYDEILRRIREEEPTKPSTRLSDSADALPSISAQRKMEPARLTRLVRGELDWIVMKALEKDRTRRYETANGFAKDLQRYLDGDDVEACPPSATYKLKKFARKHRGALATIGAFVLLLIIATAISAGLAYWAQKQRIRAVSAEHVAQEQKARAEDREQMAIDAVKRYGDVVRENPDLKNTPSLKPLRATLLKEPQAVFMKLRDRFQVDAETTPESLSRLGEANFTLGEITDEIGDRHEAAAAFEQSLTIRRRLVAEHPAVARYRNDLALSYVRLGSIGSDTSRMKEALEACEQARAILDKLAKEDPKNTDYRRNQAKNLNIIANIYSDTDKPTEAMTVYLEARKILDQLAKENPSVTEFRRWLGLNYNNVGILLTTLGRLTEAMASHAEARRLREELHREKPADSQFRRDLGWTYHYIAILQWDKHRPEIAFNTQKQALSIRQENADENPSVPNFQSDLAASYALIGSLQTRLGNLKDAVASSEKSCQILERVAKENPSVSIYQDNLAVSYFNIGGYQAALGEATEARDSMEKALAIWERLVRAEPNSTEFAGRLGRLHLHIAVMDALKGRTEEARLELQQAKELLGKVLANYPNHPVYRPELEGCLSVTAELAEQLGLGKATIKARTELAAFRASDPRRSAEARFVRVLEGKEEPENETERARIAFLAYQKKLYASSVRLFFEAFAREPRLASEGASSHRFHAACSAAMAASGQGMDDPAPNDAAKVEFRNQSLGWLKAELINRNKAFDAGPEDVRKAIASTLQHWKEDTDLAGIRDEEELAKLAEAERAAFQQLWKDVEQLRIKASDHK